MRDKGQGSLVGIASVAGFRGLPGAGAYSASKAAAISYLESLRVELHDSGVKVVTICPVYIKTPMTDINPYPMPFILEADKAASRIARAIELQTPLPLFRGKWVCLAVCSNYCRDGFMTGCLSMLRTKPRRH
ncbi:MAG: SDR family NAD(P)-dependent oxidoreductase [Nitrosomonadales bacterium]